MFGGLGIWELLLIFMIVLLFFGAKRLPEIGGSLGKGIREFKDSIGGLDEESNRELSAGDRREEGRREERERDPRPREAGSPGGPETPRGGGSDRPGESGGSERPR